MKEGDVKIVTYIAAQYECQVCFEPATQKHTYLLPNSRSNPASSGYGKDDISWCSDKEAFTCAEHKKPNLEGYRWCSTFTKGERFNHMFFYWHQKSEEIKTK